MMILSRNNSHESRQSLNHFIRQVWLHTLGSGYLQSGPAGTPETGRRRGYAAASSSGGPAPAASCEVISTV